MEGEVGRANEDNLGCCVPAVNDGEECTDNALKFVLANVRQALKLNLARIRVRDSGTDVGDVLLQGRNARL